MNKVETAKARARISATLSADPGRDLTTEEVAKAIGLPPRTTGQLLGGMHRGNLIADNGKKGKYRRWAWPLSRIPTTADETAGPAAMPAAPRPRSATPTTAAKEIELEIDGITIVVGRNPATGRFRVVLEG